MQAFKSDKNIKARVGVGVLLLLICLLVGWLVYDKKDSSSDNEITQDNPISETDKEPTGYGVFSPDFYDGVGKDELKAEEAKKLTEISITANGYSEKGSNGFISYVDNKKQKVTKLSPYTVVFDEEKLKVIFPDKIQKGDNLSVYLNEDSSAKLVVKGNKFSYLELTDVVSLDGTNYIIMEKDKTAVKLGKTIPSAYVDRDVDVSELEYGDGVLYVRGKQVKDIPSELEGYSIHSLSKARLIN